MHAANATAVTSHRAHRAPQPMRARTSRRVRRESVLAPFLAFVAIAAVLIAFAAMPTWSDASPELTTRRVRVAASDTLWSIARANPVEGLSTAQAVAAMRRLNELEGTVGLRPGSVITIPAGAENASNLAMR